MYTSRKLVEDKELALNPGTLPTLDVDGTSGILAAESSARPVVFALCCFYLQRRVVQLWSSATFKVLFFGHTII